MMSRYHSPWLFLLTGLFIFRVLAQAVSGFVYFPLLPSFEQWHSATMPYALLLFFQLVIIVIMLRVARKISTGVLLPNRRTGNILLIVGGVYFGGMIIRGALGLTLLSDNRWFANHIPTFFHLVLASYVLLVGKFHRQSSMQGDA